MWQRVGSLVNFRKLSDREAELTQEKNDLKGTSQQKDHFMDAMRTFGKILMDTLDFSQPSVQPDLAEDGKELWASLNRWKDSLKSAQAESSDSMTAEVAQHFAEIFQQAQNQMVQASRFFWTEQSCNLRQVLMHVVTKSDALDDEKRTELSDIIMQFHSLHLESPVDQIFIADSFRHRFMKEYLGLNIQKLARIYNKEMKASLQEVCASLMENHYNSFHTWLQSLLDMLTENIDKFNPVLHGHVETLLRLDADLQRYARHADSLRHYTQAIGKLMDWQDSTPSAESEQ